MIAFQIIKIPMETVTDVTMQNQLSNIGVSNNILVLEFSIISYNILALEFPIISYNILALEFPIVS